MNKDGTTLYVYSNGGRVIKYSSSKPTIIKEYKVVGESRSGYPIIAAKDKSKKYKAIGDESVLVLQNVNSYKFIESKGKIESNGSWIFGGRIFFDFLYLYWF